MKQIIRRSDWKSIGIRHREHISKQTTLLRRTHYTFSIIDRNPGHTTQLWKTCNKLLGVIVHAKTTTERIDRWTEDQWNQPTTGSTRNNTSHNPTPTLTQYTPEQRKSNINKWVSPSFSIFNISTIQYLYTHIITSIFIADCICSHRYIMTEKEIVTPKDFIVL
jgi:hypothetical protein